MLVMKTRLSSLNAVNSRSITHDFMFAYAHEKINILLSVLSIFLSFLTIREEFNKFVELVI